MTYVKYMYSACGMVDVSDFIYGKYLHVKQVAYMAYFHNNFINVTQYNNNLFI